MPYYNVVYRRVQLAEYIVQASSYQEAIDMTKNLPVEERDITENYDWEVDTQLGGLLDKNPYQI